MNATLTRSNPQTLILIDVESEAGQETESHRAQVLTTERPHRLGRIRSRTLLRPTSWATATTPPRMCL
jgi:hypothetical protein